MEGQFSHYEILGPLGSGGMGEVYRARDLRLRREVALKILSPGFAEDSERRARFLRESRLAASLSHPNVATVYEADEVDGKLFFAMELVEGKTLQERIQPGGLRLNEFLDIAIPLAEGLAAAHEAGIVHRDLKPGNTMVDERGIVKILDFGLSRMDQQVVDQTTALTATFQVMGTPQYMSPEQVQGLKVDARSDLFSMGTILYELASGERPFSGKTHQEVMDSITDGEHLPVQQANPRIDDRLVPIIDQLLEKRRDHRIQTAAGLVARLRQLRVTQDQKRGRNRQFAVAVMVVVILTVGFLILREQSEAPEFPRLAVLPFENSGAGHESLTDALTEATRSRLSKLPGITVIDRRSTYQYRGSPIPTEQIAENLDVGFILDGSVAWIELPDGVLTVVATLSLVTADGRVTWSEPYESIATDALGLRAEVADGVAKALRVRLLDQETLTYGFTDNLEAQDYYTRAIDFRNRSDERAHYDAALDLFQKALELDSGFALAYVHRAICHSLMYLEFLDRTVERADAALKDVEEAMRIAPGLPEAHMAKGYYLYHTKQDYDGALREFEVARNGLPNDSQLLRGMGYVHRRKGNLLRAIQYLERAFLSDPRSHETAFNIGKTFLWLRQYPSADQYLDEAILLAPDYYDASRDKYWLSLVGYVDVLRSRLVLEHYAQFVANDERADVLNAWLNVLDEDYRAAEEALDHSESVGISDQFEYKPAALLYSQLYEFTGDEEKAGAKFEEAREHLEQLHEDDPGDPRYLSSLGIAYAGLGLEAEAIKAGEEAMKLLTVEDDALRGVYPIRYMAEICVMLGKYEEALDHLKHLLDIPGPVSKTYLGLDPTWRELWDNPRFREIVK